MSPEQIDRPPRGEVTDIGSQRGSGVVGSKPSQGIEVFGAEGHPYTLGHVEELVATDRSIHPNDDGRNPCVYDGAQSRVQGLERFFLSRQESTKHRGFFFLALRYVHLIRSRSPVRKLGIKKCENL